MAKKDIEKLLKVAEEAVESDYTEKIKYIESELARFKKKTFEKI